jgi:hypothetical protein
MHGVQSAAKNERAEVNHSLRDMQIPNFSKLDWKSALYASSILVTIIPPTVDLILL